MPASQNDFKPIYGVTPIGTVVWAQIAAPNTKYRPEGEYGIRVRVEMMDTEVQKLLDTMKKIIDDKVEEVRIVKRLRSSDTLTVKKCWEFDRTPSGEKNDCVLFTFKSKASGIDKDGKDWKRPIQVFMPDGQPIFPVRNIFPESEVKVSYMLRPYESPFGIGCTCRLMAVQLYFSAPSKERRTAKDFGFTTEDLPFQPSLPDDDMEFDAMAFEDDYDAHFSTAHADFHNR